MMNYEEHNKQIIKGMLQDFIDAGRKPTAMAEAARWGENDLLKQLLEELPVDALDEFGGTALMNATSVGNIEAIELLISKGANVNLKSELKGKTALIYCFAASHEYATYLKVAKLLLDAGADLSIVGDDGETARDWAAKRESKELLELLDSYKTNEPE